MENFYTAVYTVDGIEIYTVELSENNNNRRLWTHFDLHSDV